MLTSQDLAARFIPLSEGGRKEILARLPGRQGEASQLSERFDGAWYRHHGSLILCDDYDNTLNLVVDGHLTVQGTLDDGSARASLVVLGDLRCQNLLTRQLMVVAGSLYCGGLIYAADSEHSLDILGESLEARALLITHRTALLPERRALDYFHDDGEAFGPMGEVDLFASSLLRYLDEDDGELSDEDRRTGASVARVVPASFGEMREVMRRLPDVFSRPFEFGDDSAAGLIRRALIQRQAPRHVVIAAAKDPDLHLDLALSPSALPTDLEPLSSSSSEEVLIAVASHPASPPHLLTRLARDASPRVRARVVHQPGLPEEVAAELARDEDAAVRQQLAASGVAPAFLTELAKDPSPDVRRAVASRVDLDDLERALLLVDRDPSVRRRALRYLLPTPSWVDRVLGAEDPEQIAWAVDHRMRMSGGDAWSANAAGLLDSRRAVREAWFARLGSRPEAMAFFHQNASTFLSDESPALRRFLACSSRDGETLAVLARDAEEPVRQAAHENLGVPPEVLVAETRRLIEGGLPVTHLLKHPRLPSIALEMMHRACPAGVPFEPHPNMPAYMVLERAQGLRPDHEPGPSDRESIALKEEPAPALFAAWLDSVDPYLRAAARRHPATPMEALLRHARRLEGPDLADLCLNPTLSFKTPAGASLLQFLLNQDDEIVARTLASNPAVPMRALREVAQRGSFAGQRAKLTAWQAFGDVL